MAPAFCLSPNLRAVYSAASAGTGAWPAASFSTVISQAALVSASAYLVGHEVAGNVASGY